MVTKWIAAYDESLASVHGLDFTDLICGVHRPFQDPEFGSVGAAVTAISL